MGEKFDTSSARSIVEAEARIRAAKTAKLRELRLAKEALEPKEQPHPGTARAASKPRSIHRKSSTGRRIPTDQEAERNWSADRVENGIYIPSQDAPLTHADFAFALFPKSGELSELWRLLGKDNVATLRRGDISNGSRKVPLIDVEGDNWAITPQGIARYTPSWKKQGLR